MVGRKGEREAELETQAQSQTARGKPDSAATLLLPRCVTLGK